MLSQPKLRASIFNLLRAALKWKLASCFIIMGIYASIIINFLVSYAFLEISYIKDSVSWFIFAAIPLLFKSVNTKEKNNILKEITSDLFKFSLLTEFVISSYTFPLFGELILIPVASFTVVIQSFASTKEQYKQVEKIFSALTLLCGFFLITFSIFQAARDFQNLASIETLISIFLPFVLSLLTAPIIFAIAIYGTYEMVAIRLKLGRKKSKSFIIFSALRIVIHFHLRLRKLRDFLEIYGSHLTRATSKKEIDSLLDEFPVL